MGLKRIIWHWTAGTHAASQLDRAHYHYVITGEGVIVEGDHRPEANLGALREGGYAAHTLNANSGSIGIAVCAMARANDRPFATGPWPVTPAQVDALVELTAALCQIYQIPVSRETVLSHAEVQPTLRIAQRGKWDISWLPGMDAPGDPVEVGDRLRARVCDSIGVTQIRPQPVPPTLRRGDRGETVKLLQRALRVLPIDGIFGPHTQQIVRDFQSDNGLANDGIVGPKTWNKLIEKGL